MQIRNAHVAILGDVVSPLRNVIATPNIEAPYMYVRVLKLVPAFYSLFVRVRSRPQEDEAMCLFFSITNTQNSHAGGDDASAGGDDAHYPGRQMS
jgi:hypothetical protein